MKGDLQKPEAAAPNFFYHLGDVVYYNGQITEHCGHFYEPYLTTTSPSSPSTIVGMYTNVPEGGSIDSEFATAPEDKAFIVALHHPIYSFDDHHSGSPTTTNVLSARS